MSWKQAIDDTACIIEVNKKHPNLSFDTIAKICSPPKTVEYQYKYIKSHTFPRIGIGVALLLMFVLLKLIGKIEWNWIWIISPIWVPILFTFTIMSGILLLIWWKITDKAAPKILLIIYVGGVLLASFKLIILIKGWLFT